MSRKNIRILWYCIVGAMLLISVINHFFQGWDIGVRMKNMPQTTLTLPENLKTAIRDTAAISYPRTDTYKDGAIVSQFKLLNKYDVFMFSLGNFPISEITAEKRQAIEPNNSEAYVKLKNESFELYVGNTIPANNSKVYFEMVTNSIDTLESFKSRVLELKGVKRLAFKVDKDNHFNAIVEPRKIYKDGPVAVAFSNIGAQAYCLIVMPKIKTGPILNDALKSLRL